MRTVCKEHSDLVNNEVCATYYQEVRAEAEIKTVRATFEKVCRVEEVCQPQVQSSASVGAREGCQYSQTRNVCYTEPALVPMVTKVRKDKAMQYQVTPQPAQTCSEMCQLSDIAAKNILHKG